MTKAPDKPRGPRATRNCRLIEEVQAYFAGGAPAKVALADELLRDRRAEAAKEREDNA
jgi:hypothetical protein